MIILKPDGPTAFPTLFPTGKTVANRATRRPDGYFAEARTRSAAQHARARTCKKNSSRSASALPVGPSGAPIRAGFARRAARRVTRRASGAPYSLTHLIKKSKGEGNEGNSDCLPLAASITCRLVMGSLVNQVRKHGLQAGRPHLPARMQGNAIHVERAHVSKPLRQAMPQVTAFIDNLRAAFGAEAIDAAIKAGIAGHQTFHAKENGHEIGTPITCNPAKSISLADCHLGYFNPANAPQTSPKGKRV